MSDGERDALELILLASGVGLSIYVSATATVDSGLLTVLLALVAIGLVAWPVMAVTGRLYRRFDQRND